MLSGFLFLGWPKNAAGLALCSGGSAGGGSGGKASVWAAAWIFRRLAGSLCDSWHGWHVHCGMCFAWYLASSASVFFGRGRPQPAAHGGKAHPWHQPWECGRPSMGSLHTAHLGPRSAHCGHAASSPPPAAGPKGLAWHIGQLSRAHCVHRQKGRCMAWYRSFLGRATVWQPAHGGNAQIGHHKPGADDAGKGFPHCGQTLQAGHSHTGLCLAWYGPLCGRSTFWQTAHGG